MQQNTLNETSSNASPFRIRTCNADSGCRYACISGKELEIKIAESFSILELPARIKVGISGCPRCCTSPKLRDIGLIGTQKGWEIHFGGNGGYHPRIALQVGAGLTEKEVLLKISQLLSVYRLHGQAGQRTSRFLDFFGEDRFINVISIIAK